MSEMKDLSITDFASLHAAFEPFMEDKRWIFRGQGDAAWKLLPKAGRPPYNQVPDGLIFESWRRRAVEYVTHRIESEWDWLSIAQHHGLATRLLDWTVNPLNAAFFALVENLESDAVIFAVMPRRSVRVDLSSPMEASGVCLLRPNGIVPRIVRQGGMFTIHPDPQEELTPDHCDLAGFKRFRIPYANRAKLLAQLAFYGVHAGSLFPDLDGLSMFLNWAVTSGEYFRKAPMA